MAEEKRKTKTSTAVKTRYNEKGLRRYFGASPERARGGFPREMHSRGHTASTDYQKGDRGLSIAVTRGRDFPALFSYLEGGRAMGERTYKQLIGRAVSSSRRCSAGTLEKRNRRGAGRTYQHRLPRAQARDV